MVRTKLVVAFALASVLASPIAGALGLGSIEINSALNQPLDARIPLFPADVQEMEALTVKLASAELFERAGVDRPFLLTRLKFTIVDGDDPHVRIHTEQPVKEPFLDFLVEADWTRGRLVREFTLLLDPPVFGESGVVTPGVVASAPSRPAEAAQGPSSPGTVAASASATAAATEMDASRSPARYGPVSANDTLWKIARSVRPDSSVSMNQTMIALLRANPDAFIDGDMNRLRRGSVLDIPDAATIASLSSEAADREARDQLQRWRSQAAADAQPSGRLQVVAPSQASADDSSEDASRAEAPTVEELQRELTTFRENSLSLEAENEDLKAQVESLKQELAELERLVNLDVERPDSAAEPEAEEAAVEEPMSEESSADAAEAEVPAEVDAAADDSAEKAPVSTPVIPPVEEPGFFDDPRNLSMLGGVLIALLVLLYLIVRRRRAEDEVLPEAEESMAPAQSADMEAEPLPEQAPAAEVEQEVEQDDDGVVVALGDSAVLSEETAIESEVELYLGHGRYEQARELLEQALQDQPENAELRLKLLETMAFMQEEAAFVDQAQRLRDQVGTDTVYWQRAQEMGREFLPTEPLFAVVVDQQADSMAPALDVEVTDQATEETVLAPMAVADLEEPEDDFSLDFELPETDVEAGTDTADSDSETEFPVLGDSSLQQQEAESFDEVPGTELDDLAFDTLSLDEGDDNVLEFSRAEEVSDVASGSDTDSLEELDEVGIKLNLARAYVDLGDSDGARSLLDEVMAEGSSAQREEAEGLLSQLA